jgi:DNA-binding MarR family transcriptional regulator
VITINLHYLYENDTKSGFYDSNPKELETLMQKSQDVLVLLRQIIRATELHDKQLSRATGLTMPQLMSMQTLRMQGPMTVGALAKEMNLTQATVTSILDRLEKKQLVTRVRSQEDKRKVLVYPTDEALILLESAPATLQDRLVQEFEMMREWEQSMVISSLERIATMLGAHTIDAAPMLDVGALDR